MNLIEGQTLTEMLEFQRRFGPEEATTIGRQVCRELAVARAAGLLHRDVSARNVIRGESGRFILMGLGVGGPSPIQPGLWPFSPAAPLDPHSSPEQFVRRDGSGFLLSNETKTARARRTPAAESTAKWKRQ
jgi:serine/threonine protein kinase